MLRLEVGQNREALEALQEAERYREAQSHTPFTYRFGSDPGLNVLNYKIWALVMLGLAREATKAQAQVLASLQRHRHSPTVGGCIHWADVWPHFLLGDLETLERNADELAAYCDEKGLEMFRALGAVQALSLAPCAILARNARGRSRRPSPHGIEPARAFSIPSISLSLPRAS